MRGSRLCSFALLPMTIVISGSALAVTLDPVFSESMVIQRDVPVNITGTATPGSKIEVSLGATKATALADDSGNWTTSLPAMKAGGPHSLKAVEGSSSVEVRDVLCGDVWVCSGQSNMQMGLHETIGGKEALAASGDLPKIRILTVGRGGADTPRKNIDAKWQPSNAETLRDFSAVAWYFAAGLKKDPALADVPLGIVNSSFGGTAIEAWMPADSLPPLPKEQISGSMFGIPPGALFNGMIAPLTALPVKGTLWYQGEANAGQPGAYVVLLENLMTQWRKAFRQPELPFFIVQLPAFDGTMGGLDFSWVRESQATAATNSEKAWTAVTHDTTDGRDLHPVEKAEIGRRLSLLARQHVYGSRLVSSGPVLKDVELRGKEVRIGFDSAHGLTSANEKPLVGFAIAGDDGDYHYAQARIQGPNVILESPAVPQPKTVRYGWGAMPNANLVNSTGLPAMPFRTDKLAPEKVAFLPMLPMRKVDAPNYQLVTGEGGKVASLIVRGKQFLSNEKDGGTRLPDGFGARNFGIMEDLGPRRIRMSDQTGSLEISCADESMQWILKNDRDNAIDFQIAFNPAAKVSFSGGTAEVSRDDVKIRVEGIERVEGTQANVKIPPKSTVSLRIRLEP